MVKEGTKTAIAAGDTVPSYYQMAFQQSSRPFILLDAVSGQILDVSVELSHMLNCSAKELIGQLLSTLLKGFDVSLLTFQKGLLPEPFQFFTRPDPVVLYYCQLESQGPYLLTCYPAAHASEMKPEWELIQHLQAQNEQLKQLSQLKSEFVANISHELRTPLTTILGWPEIILDDPDTVYPEIVLRAAHAIQRDGQHLLQLLEDLIDISKIEAGHMHLDLQQTDLNELIQQSVTLMCERAAHKQIALTYHAVRDPLILMIDPLRITQVLLNYLSNALKFTPNGGYIDIQIERSPEQVTVKVSDSGIGIPMPEQSAIFERFIQLPGKHSHLSGSSGIGLALVKNFIEMHGGKVGVNSEVGQGATFYFCLPIRPGIESVRPQTPPTEVVFTRPLTVLVVDEQADTLAVITAMLHAPALKVIETTGLAQVVSLVQTHSPDCVILNVPLQPQASETLLKQLRQFSFAKRIPVIALTAMVMQGDREKFLKMGYDAYVAKPCSKNTLFAAIQQVTEANQYV